MDTAEIREALLALNQRVFGAGQHFRNFLRYLIGQWTLSVDAGTWLSIPHSHTHPCFLYCDLIVVLCSNYQNFIDRACTYSCSRPSSAPQYPYYSSCQTRRVNSITRERTECRRQYPGCVNLPLVFSMAKLCLLLWNANGLLPRKLKLEPFFSTKE